MFGAKPPKETELDAYAKKGSEYTAAFETMAEWIKAPHYPPSYEVFRQELKEANGKFKRVSVPEMAARLIREHDEKTKSE